MSLGTRTGKRYPNPLYTRWLHFNISRIAAITLEAPISDPMRLEGTFQPPNRGKYDLDNHLKPCQDLLQRAGIIVDDALIHEVNMRKVPPVKHEDGWVKVELYTL